MHFKRSVGYSAIWCFVQVANVTKTINIFLAHFRFLKKLQIFLMLLGIMHAPHPCQNLQWYPLTSSKNIWPKITVAYFKKWFQPVFTVGGWRMYRPFNFRLLAPAYKPTQSCKRISFWSLNPDRARNHKPKPGSSPTFIFEARFRPESQPRELRYAQLQSNKKRCVQV